MKKIISMKRKILLFFLSICLWQFVYLGVSPKATRASDNSPFSGRNIVASELDKGAGIAFIENHGQFGEKTLFNSEISGISVYFCQDEVVYAIIKGDKAVREQDLGLPVGFGEDCTTIKDPDDRPELLLVKTIFVDSNPVTKVKGEGKLNSRCNYFYGQDRSKWITKVPNYISLIYEDIYPGIDLKYYGKNGVLKYDFIVSPGADYTNIRIRYEGIEGMRISDSGDLEIRTAFGNLNEKSPRIYQEIDGTKQMVGGGFKLIEPGVFGFDIDEAYDHSYPLIIDPELLFGTYLGGFRDEISRDLAVDPFGNAYVVGGTKSPDFPLLNPYDGEYELGYDIFIAKVAPSGDSLIYSTYIGGGHHEEAYGIKVDSEGHAYLAGYTVSIDFPVVNAFDSTYNDGYEGDVFLLKLSTSGDSLIYSTYLGGSGTDIAQMIAVDNQGHALLTGSTSYGDFPTVNAFDSTFNGGSDVFVTKFSQSGNALIYSTFVGGDYQDHGRGIDLDENGNAYVCGYTHSSNFPMENSFDNTFNGGDWDAFAFKLSESGNELLYSTFLGGNQSDWGNYIKVDNLNSAYITGGSESHNFPTFNAYDDSYNYYIDIIVTKLSPYGDSLIYSTYLGGWGGDNGIRLALDNVNRLFVTGWTGCSNYPVVDPYDGSYNGGIDAVLTVFSTQGNSLSYSTYFGGEDDDVGWGVVDVPGLGTYIAGWTYSTNLPIENSFDDSHNGLMDVFVAKFENTPTEITDGIKEPTEYRLVSNHPNPFNAATTIDYTLPEQSEIVFSIYNLLGQRVVTVFEGAKEAGRHSVTWDASDFPSGVYFARLETASHTENIKMVLLK